MEVFMQLATEKLKWAYVVVTVSFGFTGMLIRPGDGVLLTEK